MKRLILVLFVMACVGTCFAGTPDQTIQDDLKHEYLGKTLILRHRIEKDSQQYDEMGNLLTRAKEGPWTVYGAMTVKKLAVHPDHLDIEGPRVLLTFKQHPDAIASVPGDGTVKLKIRLAKPLDSPEEAMALLHRIFAITNEELYETVPAFWKAYVHRLTARQSQKQITDDKPTETPNEQSPGAMARSAGLVPENPPVMSDAVGDSTFSNVMKITDAGVTAPKAVFTPEPMYAEIARKRRIEGSVVLDGIIDENGRVAFSQVREPLGMGLDEMTMEALRSWRFEPARSGGKPVKVLMRLEVHFHLY